MVVTQPDTSFGVLLACAALAGFGGGNFASSMTNISFFFPEVEKGKALGLNAAGGNLGTGIVQLIVPTIVAIGAGIHLERAGLVFVPLALSVMLAWRGMDNLSGAKADYRSFANATRSRHTWIISFLYIGTFGSFIGYSGAFPTLLKAVPRGPGHAAFLGALVRRLTRPSAASSRTAGGARITIVSFALLALGALGAITALQQHELRLLLRLVHGAVHGAGIGNGATSTPVPAVFRAGITDPERLSVARKAAAGCIGIARPSVRTAASSSPAGSPSGSLVPALWVFVAAYLVMAA